MTVSPASILELNAIAQAVGKAKSTASRAWCLCVTKNPASSDGVVITTQSKVADGEPQEWTELEFNSLKMATQWLSIACLWLMAGQRGGQTEPLRTALTGMSDAEPVAATIVELACENERSMRRKPANPLDYRARLFAGI